MTEGAVSVYSPCAIIGHLSASLFSSVRFERFTRNTSACMFVSPHDELSRNFLVVFSGALVRFSALKLS